MAFTGGRGPQQEGPRPYPCLHLPSHTAGHTAWRQDQSWPKEVMSESPRGLASGEHLPLSLSCSVPGPPLTIAGPGSREVKKEVPTEPSHPRTLSLWGWNGYTALEGKSPAPQPLFSVNLGMTPERVGSPFLCLRPW